MAGKTGTSNDERDAWFIGYTPDLVVGVYVGYDNPKPMGKGRTGGELAAPIVADFMRLALRDKPATPFRVPRAIELMPIDAKSGKRGIFGERGRHPRSLQAGRRAAGLHQDHRRGHRHRRSAQHTDGGVVLVPPCRRPSPQAPASPRRWRVDDAGRRPLLSPQPLSIEQESCALKSRQLVDDMKQSIGLLRRHL